MAWKIEWDDHALKDLKKLDKQTQKDIVKYLKTRISTADSPRQFGKSLVGDKIGLWRYRVKDYRIICKIEDDRLVVVVLRTSHRKNVYRLDI
ncbi:type II toxin-antitoxin system mRNA interferase toxin, RelE/StbE family [Saccharobesus litoralis]|uniref:Type II toxin-antitoxin system mRNA interferase toxin, RelE/StbE family n=1 Tax=Saccharobesus litoralis TaxID=2172099 RepID=A0A2S0VQ15_9ALTE|nr:type II toxin-antitoxin system RelE/ParE family toxin [Saccharobesus litoralis]AWB66272.1 type II toxin-antitoxin system mRNA interferase toxin, RelE/StbE family [Saccharobesus litoralis]